MVLNNETIIIDYGAGNLRSVESAISYLGIKAVTSSDPDDIRLANRVIFPGVGDAKAAMGGLRKTGIDAALREVYQKGIPMLGICIGCQLVFTESEEGKTKCLNLVQGKVMKFRPEIDIKIPHMGWNTVYQKKRNPLLEGISKTARFYFVHSYYIAPKDQTVIVGTTNYGHEFPSMILSENLFATQFHIEKSGTWGLKILRNFLEWQP